MQQLETFTFGALCWPGGKDLVELVRGVPCGEVDQLLKQVVIDKFKVERRQELVLLDLDLSQRLARLGRLVASDIPRKPFQHT